MNEIERLSRMRRNILWGVLAGTVVAVLMLFYPIIFRSGRYHWWPAHQRIGFPLYYGAFLIWLVTLLVFAVLFRFYKRKLRKDPVLRIAVDDERVTMIWLKAYRFAFLALVGVTILAKLAETALSGMILRGSFPLPDKTWFLLAGAVISLVGSFLYFSRETGDE